METVAGSGDRRTTNVLYEKFNGLKRRTPMPEEATPDYKTILFSLCAGMFLCDHMGDVADDVYDALELAGIDVTKSEDISDIRRILPRPVLSLWGTDLNIDEYNE